ncbi:MAG: substrate-binding domain-containing protein [Spirochaetales bacterium]|nr:substrate-binding domain-containing protein [Spirochaetales bacterium]
MPGSFFHPLPLKFYSLYFRTVGKDVKPLFIVLLFILFIAFLVSAVLSVSFLLGVKPEWDSASETSSSPARPYIAVLLPDSRDTFLKDLLVGIHQKAVKDHIDLEIYRYGIAEGSQSLNLERLTMARIAGVLLLPSEDPKITAAIDQAEKRNIPVVLIQNDVPQSHRRAFVGPSSYQLGLEAGRLIKSLKISSIHAGILLSQSDQTKQTVQSSLFVNGLSDGLEMSLSDFSFEERISPPGRFAGEELVWQIMHDDPLLNVLITTNPKDSLSALQVVVEANRVKKIRLVAVGEDKELQEALKQKVIQALILRDPVRLGEEAMSTMSAILQGKPVSSYRAVPVHGYLAGQHLP